MSLYDIINFKKPKKQKTFYDLYKEESEYFNKSLLEIATDGPDNLPIIYGITDRKLLQEAYYGKNKYLESIENSFQNIIDETEKDKYYSVTDKINEDICDNIMELFNFQSVNLTFDNFYVASNACTFPICETVYTKDSKYDVNHTSKGVRWKNKKGKRLVVVFGLGLIANTKLTAEECTAVLLHEIGHNFYIAKTKIAATNTVNNSNTVISNIAKIFNNEKFKDQETEEATKMFALNEAESKIDKKQSVLSQIANKDEEAVIRKTHKFTRVIVNVAGIISNIMSMIPDVTTILLLNILGLLTPSRHAADGYKNEKFSDNFATSYGYGKEISSVMRKFSDKRKMTDVGPALVYKIPVIRESKHLNDLITEYLILTKGKVIPHPSEYTRIKDQAIKLKHDLNSQKKLTKEQRQEMLEQVEYIENLTEYMEVEVNKGNKNYVKYLNDLVLYKVIGLSPDDKRESKDLYKTEDYDWERYLGKLKE